MKKIALVSLMTSLSLNSFVHAGAMGDASCTPSAFVALEGGYSWNKINGFEFTSSTTTISAVKQQNQYTVRLAAGLIHMMDDDWGLTGELGWGYYGRTTFNLPVISLAFPINATSKYTISGFDALIGGAFIQPYYSLSLKVGGLIQNMQQSNTASLNYLGGAYTINEKHTSAAVLPALKLGGAYNIDANWGITASYLFAFGASTGTTATYTPAAATNFSLDINTQNPTINAFMIGVQYSA